ncbi:MAG: translational GTPase TypA [Clostridium sp.]
MNKFTTENIRNIAIIAHVDHGKTTLVDELLKQSGTFRSNEKTDERMMDSNDLERERGITILSKNTAVIYNDLKINIIDTPGHADFGGEVERVLKMVDGVVLLVDAFEGAMPQTRFVLRKALELKIKPIVVINKIDKPGARPAEVVDEVLELFIELGADDDQLEFPVVYASGKAGIAKMEMEEEAVDLVPLFETVIKNVPCPAGNSEEPLQMLVTTIDANEYVGRIAIGKVQRGIIKKNQPIAICSADGKTRTGKIVTLYTFNGLKREETEEAISGDIIAISGIADISIGETIADAQNPEAIPFVNIDEPTLSMTFSVNDSPFAGKEGDYVTTRHLRERLMKELETNVSLRVKDTDATDSFEVSGRGELHLSVLIETMRREGYEFQVSRPNVIYKEIDGVKHEPIELLTVDVPEEYMGAVMEKLGQRKAEMTNMTSAIDGYVRLEFNIPARGLIGYRSEFMTDTKGNGIMNHLFEGYEVAKGDIPERNRGALIAFETGESVTYGLFNSQDRGTLFVGPNTPVYQGMIVGVCSRAEDIDVNVCRKKQATNMRSSGADESLRLVPALNLSLEQSLEFISSEELVEVTPKSVRMRKKMLDPNTRKRANRNK